MKRVAERKTRLTVITSETARYRGREREIVLEIQPHIAVLRLHGCPTRYELSWRGIFDFAGRVTAERQRAERRRARKAKP